MGKHLPDNKKWNIAVNVLEGMNYAKAGREFGIPRQTAHDICQKYFFKVFPLLTEREELNINMNDLDSLRKAWSSVCPK